MKTIKTEQKSDFDITFSFPSRRRKAITIAKVSVGKETLVFSVDDSSKLYAGDVFSIDFSNDDLIYGLSQIEFIVDQIVNDKQFTTSTYALTKIPFRFYGFWQKVRMCLNRETPPRITFGKVARAELLEKKTFFVLGNALHE